MPGLTRDEDLGALFAALADPTRRQVIRSLSGAEPVTASGLAAELPMTRQAIAKHLGALREAGLVVAEPAGREVRYRLTPAPFAEAMLWMASTGARWDERLARLEQRLAQRAGSA